MKPKGMAHWLEIAREAITGHEEAGKAPAAKARRSSRPDVAGSPGAKEPGKPVELSPPTMPVTRSRGSSPAPRGGPVPNRAAAHHGLRVPGPDREAARPDMPPLEWDASPAKPLAAGTAVPGAQAGSSYLRRKIRERYLNVRFPGTPHAEADLRDTVGIVKRARLYFEDGDVDRAAELLQFAGDLEPGEEARALALLEILYLARRARAYGEAAREHRERFPESDQWSEIARLGARLLPGDPLFMGVAAAKSEPGDHYGAWPQTRNWIQAPFDLTGDVLAAEFHAKLRGGGAAAPIAAKASGR